jgi:hypothetical protein
MHCRHASLHSASQAACTHYRHACCATQCLAPMQCILCWPFGSVTRRRFRRHAHCHCARADWKPPRNNTTTGRRRYAALIVIHMQARWIGGTQSQTWILCARCASAHGPKTAWTPRCRCMVRRCGLRLRRCQRISPSPCRRWCSHQRDGCMLPTVCVRPCGIWCKMLRTAAGAA